MLFHGIQASKGAYRNVGGEAMIIKRYISNLKVNYSAYISEVQPLSYGH